MHLELLLVELVQQCGQDLESFLHDREGAVLIVSMVDTAVAIPTHLGREEGEKGGGGGGREGRRRKRERREEEEKEENEGVRKLLHHIYYKPVVFMLTHLYIKPCLLEVSDQWETACDGVWLALSHHLLRCLVELLKSI